MFNWNVAEMKLMNERSHVCIGDEMLFGAEHTASREDKIAFIDSMTEGKMSYLLNLIEKWNEDVKTMPKDTWGNPKSVSVIAWCKRNDTKYLPARILDVNYHYGNFRFVGCERYIYSADQKGCYDTYADFVDEIFHRQLKDCYRKEKSYFQNTDEYEVAKNQLRDYFDKYKTSFGMRLAYSSNNTITVIEEEGSWKGPEITMQQCKVLLDLYHRLDKAVEDMTAECAEAMKNL